MDVGKDELGDMVDKEMAATSAAIEEAVRRIDVSIRPYKSIKWFVILILLPMLLYTAHFGFSCCFGSDVNCGFVGNDESSQEGHNRSKAGSQWEVSGFDVVVLLTPTNCVWISVLL